MTFGSAAIVDLATGHGAHVVLIVVIGVCMVFAAISAGFQASSRTQYGSRKFD